MFKASTFTQQARRLPSFAIWKKKVYPTDSSSPIVVRSCRIRSPP